MRRALILISKVVQNVANEVEFGDKEAYMMPMNAFIKENIPRMKCFLDVLSSAVLLLSLSLISGSAGAKRLQCAPPPHFSLHPFIRCLPAAGRAYANPVQSI